MNGSNGGWRVLVVTAVVIAVGAVAGAQQIPLAGGEAARFELVAQRDGGATVDVVVPEAVLSAVEIDGRTWARVEVPGARGLMQRGLPDLPFIGREYVLGDADGVRVELVGLQSRTLDLAAHGYAGVAPSKGHFTRDVRPEDVPWSFDEKVYGGVDVFPAEPVWTGTPYIAGPRRGVAVRVPLARWSPELNRLEVVERATFRVTHTTDAVNPRRRTAPPASAPFAPEAGALRAPGGTRFDEVGRLLILVPDAFVEEIAPLAAWERQVGYPTIVKPLSSVPHAGASPTAAEIKTFIQSVYDEPASLAWIILVGDAAQLPTLVGVQEGADCDPCYAKLEGADNHQDAAVSRLSATTEAQVATQVAKILAYEQTPDTGSAGAWYSGGFGIAGDDSGGSPAYQDWERMEFLRKDLVTAALDPAAPSYTYDAFDQLYHSPSDSQVAASIAVGRGLGLYIGHGSETSWVTSGFNVADVHALANGSMLPVIWSVACVNGDFVGTGECFAEAWLRQAGGGAVLFEGATTNESWVPPTDAQRGFVDALRNETHFTVGGQHLTGKEHCMSLWGDSNSSQGTMFMEQSHLFGSCLLWQRTLPAVAPDEPTDFALAGGVASLTVRVDGAPYARENGAIVSFYTRDGESITLLGSGLIGADGVVQAAVTGVPTHCHVHGFNLIPSEFELLAQAEGRIALDGAVYGCDATVTLRVGDANVPGTSPDVVDTMDVTLEGPGGSTTVTLTEEGPDDGFFSGSHALGSTFPVSDGEALTATYVDADDGAGGVDVVRTAGAVLDCAAPVISNVSLIADHESATVRFTTDEPASVVVRYGLGTPSSVVAGDALDTSHEVTIPDLASCTDYVVSVEVADAVGNLSVDDNAGAYHAVRTAGWQTLVDERFDGDPGWTIDNGGSSLGWAFGAPTGAGGVYGEADPTSGHSGSFVYGVNLQGDYENNLGDDQLALTMPALDCSDVTSVQLSYWRWLGVEGPSFDHARVQVSTDGGSSWAAVWQNTARIDGGSWVQEVLDLTALAAGQSDVRIRWTQGSTDGSWRFAGWNLDDVVVEGAAPCPETIFDDSFESGDCGRWSADEGAS